MMSKAILDTTRWSVQPGREGGGGELVENM